jgi:hypothetical protein
MAARAPRDPDRSVGRTAGGVGVRSARPNQGGAPARAEHALCFAVHGRRVEQVDAVVERRRHDRSGMGCVAHAPHVKCFPRTHADDRDR